MKVFVLMADGGYDGDSLLGVYATEQEAIDAGRKWKPDSGDESYTPYVVPVELGTAARIYWSDESRT